MQADVVRRIFSILGCFLMGNLGCNGDFSGSYTNEWAVCIQGGMKVASEVAKVHGFRNLGLVSPFDDIYKFVHVGVHRRHRRSAAFRSYYLNGDRRVLWTEQQVIKKRVKRTVISYDDQRWKDQWYLNRREKGMEGHDMNVLPAWTKGITGKGVVVSILDDGIEYNHPELKGNYDKDASYDYNSNDPDPTPRWTVSDSNGHGTRCAAEVAAVANNSNCIVGVAYNANIGGIRMLDGDITDLTEAQSLSHQRNYIDIYSASWGPDDDGKTVDGPGNVTKRVFEEGALKGRGGKGNIFVWASGNGGHHYDNCNCDGYTNSIYTISVSTATDSGAKPWYLESCASSLVTTYGTGHYGFDKQIVTADLQSECTARHTGTSVAAPFIAGFLALALQVKPSLTWRDVQHLVVNTATLKNLASEDVQVNGAGRKFSHHFGYGMIDGGALVNLAEKWHLVSEHRKCKSNADKRLRVLNNTKPLVTKISTDGCQGTSSYIRYLEHVHVIVTLSHSMRGSVSIFLMSPDGTRSQVLAPRKKDDRRDEFRNWAFMSTHFWGEDPNGVWTIEITSGFKDRRVKIHESGFLEEWKLVFYGTEFEPGKEYKKTNGSEGKDHGEESGITCHSECSEGCHGPGPDQCSKCKNFVFGNKTCVNGCPEKFFVKMDATGQKMCRACHTSCRFCSGETKSECTACFDNMVLSFGQCQQKCPKKHFWSSVTLSCQKCNKRCVDCFGTPKNCTACPKGMLVKNGKCIQECKGSQYLEGEVCRHCHSSCETCIGPKKSDCTACRIAKLFGLISFSSHFLLNGTCLTRCPAGYYVEYLRCRKCAPNCKVCRGGHDEDCVACKDGHFRVLGSNTCVKSCPKGHFPNFNHKLCEPCVHLCEECVPGRGDQCLSCSKGSVLEESRCVFADKCNYGFFANLTTKRCELCPYPCAACNSLGQCISCALDLYMSTDGKCVDKCPYGSYLNDTVARCMTCYPGCKECSGPSESHCISCQPGRYLQRGKCVKRCPRRGFFANKLTGICSACYHFCAECDGPKPNQCKKCIKNLDLRDSSCYPPCIDKYLSENSCKPCDRTCRSCFGPSLFDCLSCPENHYLNPVTYSCSASCPTGYYKGSIDFTCHKCHPSCGSCNGDLASNCLTCAGTLTLFNGSCTRHCPGGYYVTGERMCEPCRKECSSCLYKPGVCTTCRKGYVLNELKCKKTCIDGFFLAKDANRCFACSKHCKSCTGFAANECTSCENEYVLWKSMCLQECPPGYTAHLGKCFSCDSNCAKCPVGSGCTACKKPFVLLRGKCVDTCPSRYVAIYNKCERCHKTCKECFHTDRNSCISCRKRWFKTPLGECFPKCPAGTYPIHKKRVCQYCHELCETCAGGSIYNCTRCTSGLLVDSVSKLCVHECPNGSYQKNYTCQVCHEMCESCTDGGKTNCTACHLPRLLHKGECINGCPSGTYENSLLQQCMPCHRHCLRCNGPSDTDCLKCTQPSVLHVGQCLPECPGGFYRDEKTASCLFCSQNCLKCQGPFGYCSECLEPYKIENGKCVLPCELHYFYNVSKDECQECHSSCQTCLSSGNRNCTSCPTHFVLRNGSCSVNCKDGYFFDTNELSCQQCHFNCSTCTGPGINDCISCKNGLKKSDVGCEPDCTVGFVYDNQTQTCKPCKSSCIECSPTDLACNRCVTGMYLQDGYCVRNCRKGYFLDKKLQHCLRCNHSCLECFGEQGQFCKKCNVDFILHKQECLIACPMQWTAISAQCRPCPENCNYCRNETSCDECKMGYFLLRNTYTTDYLRPLLRNILPNLCVTCQANCKICNTSNSCTECSSGFYKEEGQCVQKCGDEFYLDTTSTTCQPLANDTLAATENPCQNNCSQSYYLNSKMCECLPCINNCMSCNSSSTCNTCLPGFASINNTCQSLCKKGTFFDAHAKSCKYCPSGCVECDSNGLCTECSSNWTLNNGKCEFRCLPGQGLDKVGNKCQSCSEKCITCANATHCILCPDHLLLIDGSCITTCPKEHFFEPLTNKCIACPYSCSNCTSKETGSCVSCKQPYWLQKGECVDNCTLLGQFPDIRSMACEQCPPDCISCSNFSTCLKCNTSSYLEEGVCVTNCSSGYIPDTLINVCVKCQGKCDHLKPLTRGLKSIFDENDKVTPIDSYSKVTIATFVTLPCILTLLWKLWSLRNHRVQRDTPDSRQNLISS